MFHLSSSVKIFVCTKPADMRRSFNGLFELVRSHFLEDPYSGSLFIFRSRRGDFIKIIWWDSDGFAIFSKKLEMGTFRFPEVKFIDGKYAPAEIERTDLLLLLEGIDTESVKRLKRYKHPNRNPQYSDPPKVLSRNG